MSCFSRSKKQRDLDADGQDSEFLPFIATLPKESYRVKISPFPSPEPLHIINGPNGREDMCEFGDLASACSISTYPHLEGNKARDGEPICDVYHAEIFSDRVVCAVADGCGWGNKPQAAASNAVLAAVDFVKKSGHTCKTVKDTALLLLGAMDRGHYAIITSQRDMWEVGTTTLALGVMLPLPPQDSAGTGFGFVAAVVGDSKFFVYSPSSDSARDITAGNRPNSADPTDCGGRIGPQLDEGAPDLRNLRVWFTPVSEGDIILALSDGVHDNLDPQYLGLQPHESGPIDPHLTWDAMDPVQAERLKSEYRAGLIAKAARECGNNCTQIVRHLLEHSRSLTQPSRDFMIANPIGKRLPVDYKNFPGKMDHSTALMFKVATNYAAAAPAGVAGMA